MREEEHVPIFEENESKTIEENQRLIVGHFFKPAKKKYRKLMLNIDKPIEQTDEEELRDIISRMSNDKAPGIDQLPNRLIKILFASNRQYFVDLYNLILKRCRIPKSWKTGLLIFFAKPNRVIKSPADLRPITLLIGFLKIAEALFSRRIEHELNERNFFSPHQFAYQKGKSTVDAVERVVREMQKAKKHNYAAVISLDASMAFDSINWNVIIDNLIEARASSTCIRMCQELLTDRKVTLNGTEYETERGVSQGGCASPLLWRIGCNNLPTELSKLKRVRESVYADDTGMIVYGNTRDKFDDELRKAIDVAKNWCDRAEVQLNAGKTEAMSIGKKTLQSVMIDQKEIKTKKHLKLLGIVLDRRLTFNPHLDHIKQKVEQLAIRIRSLCWMNDEISLRKRMRIYRSVFLPTMTYGLKVWHQFVEKKTTYIARLQSMQNSVIRTITGAYKSTNHQKLLEITGEVNTETELDIIIQADQQEKSARGELKKQLREESRRESRSFYAFVNLIFGSLVTRAAIWCLTGTGPFKFHLNRIGKTEDLDCRFCGQSDETSEHLLFECTALNLGINLSTDTRTFEIKASRLIEELRRRA